MDAAKCKVDEKISAKKSSGKCGGGGAFCWCRGGMGWGGTQLMQGSSASIGVYRGGGWNPPEFCMTALCSTLVIKDL
jgi:hypothetical protein